MTHSDQRSLRSNTLWRLTQVMGSGGFAALYVLIYTALLTKGEYGTYGAVVSVAGFLLLVAIFGMRQTLTRFVARARGAGELGSVRAYIVTALRLTGAFTALVVIASWMCTPLLVRTFTGWTPWITLLVTFNVSARAFVQVLQGALEGSSRFRDVSLRAMTLDVLQLAGVGTLALSGMSLVRLLAVECVVQTVGVLIFAHHVRAAVLASISFDLVLAF